jgi:hypothetical protein
MSLLLRYMHHLMSSELYTHFKRTRLAEWRQNQENQSKRKKKRLEGLEHLVYTKRPKKIYI